MYLYNNLYNFGCAIFLYDFTENNYVETRVVCEAFCNYNRKI